VTATLSGTSGKKATRTCRSSAQRPEGKLFAFTHARNDSGGRRHAPDGCCFLLQAEHGYRRQRHGSRQELRDFPLFMQRVAFFPDVPDSEAVTDIYLPLR